MSTVPEPHRVRGAATVFSDFAAVLIARLSSALLSLVSVLITTHLLDPEAYGVVAYVGVIAFLIFVISSSWTTDAVSRYGREEFDERGSMLAVTWARIRVTAPLLVISALAVILLKLAGGLPEQLTWPLTWLAIGAGVVQVAAEHITYSLQATGRMKTSGAQLLTQQVLMIAPLAALLATGVAGSPVVVVSVTLASGAICTVVYGRLVSRTSLWPPRSDPELRRRFLRFSTPLIAFVLSLYAIRIVDLIVIGAFATAATVGLYALAYQAYMVLEQQFTTAAGAVLTPLFVSLRSAQQDQLVNRYVERAIPQLMLIAATLAGLAVPFVGIVVPAVFGQEYGGASEPFAILLFALLLALAANLLLPSILLEERTTPIATVNVVAVVVNVVGDIVLVGFEHQPLIGPAIATSAATATIVIGYVGILRDHTSARPTLPIVPLVPFVAGFIPAVTLTHALAIPTSIAATAVCAAIVMVCAKPFEHEDVKLISQLDMPLALKRLTVRTLELTAR